MTTTIIIIIAYTVSINACIADGSFFSFVSFILSKGRAREKSHPFPSITPFFYCWLSM